MLDIACHGCTMGSISVGEGGPDVEGGGASARRAEDPRALLPAGSGMAPCLRS